MENTGFSDATRVGQFNTLAQIGTTTLISKQKKRPITVTGNGSALCETPMFTGRARRKLISQKLMLSLIDVATKRGAEDWIQSYWNTYYCQSHLIKSGNKVYSDYCKNRFCTVCACNRKADIINRYLPVIDKWETPYFVTLTAKAVPAHKLKSRIDRMILSMKKLLARNKKRWQRDTGIKIECIRTLECNFNPIKRTYNPHFHLIVSTKEAAELIINEWLEQCTPQFAVRAAQDMRPVIDKTKDLIEVVKYSSKIFTDPTMKKGNGQKVTPFVYASAFHNIICALDGHRVFEKFGFTLPKYDKSAKRTVLTEYESLLFDPVQFDWVNIANDNHFTKYVPDPQLLALLANNIDKDLQ
jgi:hypothetical protein